MDVAVQASRGKDFALARDNVGAVTDDDGHAGLDVRIAGLADGADIAFLDGDIGLYDSPMIDDQRIGDDGIGRPLLVAARGLAHAAPDPLAAAEFHLLAVDGEILFDLDDEVSVGQPHPIACRGPEHVGIDGTLDLHRPCSAPAASSPLTAPPSLRRGSRRRHACRQAPRAARLAFAPAQTAPPCLPRYRAACRALSCGRTSAPDWSRRNDSASRPGSDDRLSWQQ